MQTHFTFKVPHVLDWCCLFPPLSTCPQCGSHAGHTQLSQTHQAWFQVPAGKLPCSLGGRVSHVFTEVPHPHPTGHTYFPSPLPSHKPCSVASGKRPGPSRPPAGFPLCPLPACWMDTQRTRDRRSLGAHITVADRLLFRDVCRSGGKQRSTARGEASELWD